MKTLSLLLLLATSLHASTVKLQWNQSQETNVVGYRVYWGPASLSYDHWMEVLGVTNTTATVSNLVNAPTYYLTVRSFTDDGLESPVADEVIAKNVKLTTHFQSAMSLDGPWTDLWERVDFVPAAPEVPLFYRTRVEVEPPSPYLKPSPSLLIDGYFGTGPGYVPMPILPR